MVTDSALLIRKAASSGLPDFTLRCAWPAPQAAAPGSAPKTPRSPFKTHRFMPLHLLSERLAPDDPTSEPAMPRTGLFTDNPMPPLSNPEYLLHKDTHHSMLAR